MKQITLLNTGKLVLGDGSTRAFANDFIKLKKKRLFIIISKPVQGQFEESAQSLARSGITLKFNNSIDSEPDFEMFENILHEARDFGADSVIGVGGGSVLDVAKLVAVFIESNQNVREAVGIDKLSNRSTYLACLPTTAGTGSEVSPNAILLDRKKNLKKGIVSPYLVPDAAYIDPLYTHSLPARLTASTGLDALTHCLEAYTNIHAHPMMDLYALEGIRLISHNLKNAIKDGSNSESRSNLALGSLYGGYCLGPVNTTAVHALSYPLGGMFHIPHGLSNALLLPYVMEFNLGNAPERFADVALALGAKEGPDALETAKNGVQAVKKLMKECDVPMKISELDIPESSLEMMAESAITVTRLLKNNVREVTYKDALQIYRNAY